MTSSLAFCALAILTIGVPIGAFAQTADLQATTKPLPAFTIEIIRRWSNGASERIMEAYKSDGSFLAAGLHIPGTILVHVIFSVQDQSYTELHHDVKAKCTLYRPTNILRRAAPEDPTCETPHSSAGGISAVIGKDVFLGLPVVKHRTQSPGGDTFETWEAPHCGCMAIFSRQTEKNPPIGANYVLENEATKIVLGEPKPELFVIPADYVEKPPSQIRIERFVKNGWTMSKAVKASLKSKDEQYWRSQAFKPTK